MFLIACWAGGYEGRTKRDSPRWNMLSIDGQQYGSNLPDERCVCDLEAYVCKAEEHTRRKRPSHEPDDKGNGWHSKKAKQEKMSLT
jgi:hypothetical protein